MVLSLRWKYAFDGLLELLHLELRSIDISLNLCEDAVEVEYRESIALRNNPIESKEVLNQYMGRHVSLNELLGCELHIKIQKHFTFLDVSGDDLESRLQKEKIPFSLGGHFSAMFG